jgi:hypothetical protein
MSAQNSILRMFSSIVVLNGGLDHIGCQGPGGVKRFGTGQRVP